MITIDTLKGFPLFSELSNEALSKIIPLCQERSFSKGSIIFTSGGFANDIYLLKSGKVDIQIEFKIYDYEILTTVYTVEEKEIFGWSALVPPHRLTASARCEKDSEVITINGKKLLDLFDQEKEVGYLVMKHLSTVISSRLAATTIALRHEIQKLIRK